MQTSSDPLAQHPVSAEVISENRNSRVKSVPSAAHLRGYIPSHPNTTRVESHTRVRSFIESLPDNPGGGSSGGSQASPDTKNGASQELATNDTKTPLLAWPASSQCENITPLSSGILTRSDSQYSTMSVSETSSMDSTTLDPLHERIKHFLTGTLEPTERMQWDLYVVILMVWISIVTPYTVCFGIPVS